MKKYKLIITAAVIIAAALIMTTSFLQDTKDYTYKEVGALSTISSVLTECIDADSFFIPKWVVWENRCFNDESNVYEIHLDNQEVKVYKSDNIIWNSSKEVKVQDVFSGDIDGDKTDELILLCWKIGRYGKHKPFWVEKDENIWSQHIFVYEYNDEHNNGVRPKWMSSYIGQDVISMSIDKTKPHYHRLILKDLDESISSWVWDSWGFTKEDTDVSFVVFGDNLIHEPIYRYGLLNDESFGFLYENVKENISNSDIAVINQETPLVTEPGEYSDYPRFGTPINVGKAISEAGFEVVTCATNHALDKGIKGINITKEYFESKDILCLGIQSEDETEYQPYEIITRNGIRFALLNYTYGTNGTAIPDDYPNIVHLLDNEEKIQNDISKAKADSDFVIVFVHWGTENMTQTDDYQKKWSEIFMESKADVVIGTHPHVLQPYEMLTDSEGHNMLIYYSIGNYISAQSQKKSIKGGMASFTVSLTQNGYCITEYNLTPLRINAGTGGKFTVEICDKK